MGIALRHVPESKAGHALTRFLWANVIPGMTLLATRSRDAKLLMDCWTRSSSVPPDEIVRAMQAVGFEAPHYEVVMPGSFCEYTGTKAPR